MDTVTATIIVASITTAGSLTGVIFTALSNKGLKKENKSLADTKQNLEDTKQKLEVEIKEIKLISTGMVVAYFFSFIKPFFNNISESDLVIVDGEKKYTINGNNTKLELIIPKQLDNNSFEEAKNYNKSIAGTGAILNTDGKILYKEMSFRIDKSANDVIFIVDIPSILRSALQYYKIPMFETKSNLQALLEREMTNFRNEIERMIDNDDLKNKVIIRQNF